VSACVFYEQASEILPPPASTHPSPPPIHRPRSTRLPTHRRARSHLPLEPATARPNAHFYSCRAGVRLRAHGVWLRRATLPLSHSSYEPISCVVTLCLLMPTFLVLPSSSFFGPSLSGPHTGVSPLPKHSRDRSGAYPFCLRMDRLLSPSLPTLLPSLPLTAPEAPTKQPNKSK
jgi:hypothetical protein